MKRWRPVPYTPLQLSLEDHWLTAVAVLRIWSWCFFTRGSGYPLSGMFFPGSWNSDPRSRIQPVFFESILFWVKKYLNICQLNQIFFYTCFKKFNNLQFLATKSVTTNLFFPPPFSLLLDPGSEMEKISGSGNIRNLSDKHPGSGTLCCVELMQEDEHKWQLAEMRIRLAQHYANQGNWIHVQHPEIGRWTTRL